MEKNNTDAYVVQATAFGHANQIISTPLNNDNAEALATKIKESMKDLDKDFQIFTNVKVVKYELQSMDTEGLLDDKKDPYNYSILDQLEKNIKSEK